MLEDLIPKKPSYHGDMAGRPPLKDAPTFGTHLAALRKARDMKQPVLAKELGISLAALTHYERKAENPSTEFVARVAKFFNVSVDDLLGVTVKPVRKSGPPSQLEARLKALRRLPPQKQKVVLQLIDSFIETSKKLEPVH